MKNLRNGELITGSALTSFFQQIAQKVNGLVPKYVVGLTMRCFRYRQPYTTPGFRPENVDPLMNTSSLQWTAPYKNGSALYFPQVNLMKKIEEDIEIIVNM